MIHTNYTHINIEFFAFNKFNFLFTSQHSDCMPTKGKKIFYTYTYAYVNKFTTVAAKRFACFRENLHICTILFMCVCTRENVNASPDHLNAKKKFFRGKFPLHGREIQ